MFDTLFTYPAVLKRHREGPFAAERAGYLAGLAAQGMARGTLLLRARYSLRIAWELDRWPAAHRFAQSDIAGLSAGWASKRSAEGWASGPRWPEELFRFVATDFLRAVGRMDAPASPAPGRYEGQVEDFVAAQRQGRWQSEATCRSGRWQVERFLTHIEQQGIVLGEVEATDIDGFVQHMALRWGRISLCASAKVLRSWFTHCEAHGWVRPGLAAAVLLPRIYRQEGLPLGPTWDSVGRMLAHTAGDDPIQARPRNPSAAFRLRTALGRGASVGA